MTSLLIDLRRDTGHIWNRRSVATLGRRRSAASPSAESVDDTQDNFVYRGYLEEGASFLTQLRGPFSCAVHDEHRHQIFLARDWIGEVPFHYLATPTGFFVANTIADLRRAAGDFYKYKYVRAFPQSKYQLIDVRDVMPACVAATSRPHEDMLYYDFAAAVRSKRSELNADLDSGLEDARDDLQAATESRLEYTDGPISLLLSGGLDSFSVGLMLREAGVKFITHTLVVGDDSDDARVAKEFARYLGVPHELVSVTSSDIHEVAEAAVGIGETYHLYNYYCAVGMCLLGERLADRGVRAAFCGEAVNEAVGDYHDWVLRDPRTGREVILQKVPFDRMQRTDERILYVWGQARDRFKYNRQLGTGLAKHAGSRMYKPFMHYGIDLHAPYYSRTALTRLTAIDGSILADIGGKPGLFLRLFARDIQRIGIPESVLLGSSKTRLQDGSNGGGGGLTPVLLSAGFDQRRLIAAFNEAFAADLDPRIDGLRLQGLGE